MRTLCLIVCFAVLQAVTPFVAASESDTVFAGFTRHIAAQVASDKQSFVRAEICTIWFYRQREHKPPPPAVEGVAYRHQAADALAEHCPRQYPGGLEAAREAFGRTQSNLSLSLTFYEFALVGDRDDDDRYNASELRDLLESCGLPADDHLSPPHQLAALTGHFDALHQAGGLERLMTGMGALYDKGYRFTRRDRAALDKISG